MFTNPHNQNLLNDVMRVMNGDTTEQPIKPAPKWLIEAASVAAQDILAAQKTTIMTSEGRRDILRQHLSEAISNCNCEVTKEMPVQFDDAVTKAVNEAMTMKPAETAMKSKPEAAKLAKPAEVKAKTETPAEKGMPKNVGLGSKGKNPAKIGEEMEAELREFLTQLTTEEIATLRNIINETR